MLCDICYSCFKCKCENSKSGCNRPFPTVFFTMNNNVIYTAHFLQKHAIQHASQKTKIQLKTQMQETALKATENYFKRDRNDNTVNKYI